MDKSYILQKICKESKQTKKLLPYLQKEAEEIITELTLELGLHKQDVREVVYTQFKFVDKVIRTGTLVKDEKFDINSYKSVRLLHLGRFIVAPTFKKRFG